MGYPCVLLEHLDYSHPEERVLSRMWYNLVKKLVWLRFYVKRSDILHKIY